MTSYLLLHGWQNHRGPDHWQALLAADLGERGHRVARPQLPDPDTPQLGPWLRTLDDHLAELGSGERVVVAHSLGCLLWLHAVARPSGVRPVQRVLLVAPPAPAVAAGHAEMAGFVRPVVPGGALRAAASTTRVVGAVDDRYCPSGVVDGVLRPLDLVDAVEVDVLAGGGHLDPDAGYGDWPSVLAWCLDPAVRLVPR